MLRDVTNAAGGCNKQFQRRKPTKEEDPPTPVPTASSSSEQEDGGSDACSAPSTSTSSSSTFELLTPSCSTSAATWAHTARRQGRRSSMLPYESVFAGEHSPSHPSEQPGTRLLWMRGMSRAKRKAYHEYIQHMAQLYAEVDAFDLVEEESGAQGAAAAAAVQKYRSAAMHRPVPGPAAAAAAADPGLTGSPCSMGKGSCLSADTPPTLPRPCTTATAETAGTAAQLLGSPAATTAEPSRRSAHRLSCSGLLNIEQTHAVPEAAAAGPPSSTSPGSNSTNTVGGPALTAPAAEHPTPCTAGSLGSSQQVIELHPGSSSRRQAQLSPLTCSDSEEDTEEEVVEGEGEQEGEQHPGTESKQQQQQPAGRQSQVARASGAGAAVGQALVQESVSPSTTADSHSQVSTPGVHHRTSLLASPGTCITTSSTPAAAPSVRGGAASLSLQCSPAATPAAGAAATTGRRSSMEGSIAGMATASAGRASPPTAAAAKGPVLPPPKQQEDEDVAARLDQLLLSDTPPTAAPQARTGSPSPDSSAAARRLSARHSMLLEAASPSAPSPEAQAPPQQQEPQKLTQQGEQQQVVAEMSSLQRLLLLCDQGSDAKGIPSMTALLKQVVPRLQQVVKIGEGSYGEAFKLAGVVVKLVPIEGKMPYNGGVQKTAPELEAEALIALTLTQLQEKEQEGDEGGASSGAAVCHTSVTTAFVETYKVGVCRGPVPASLLRAWDAWDTKKGSENDPLSGLPTSQLYFMFAMADGGRDLEAYQLAGYDQARSMLLQVALALAVAEEALGFEHRDLHWGNVLLAPAASRTTSFRLRGQELQVQCQGALVTLIDFTASRLQLLTGGVAFCDLEQDPTLFEGPKDSCQANTYRRMRQLLKGCWQDSAPRTNLLWLHYLADVVLTEKALPGVKPAQKKKLREFRQRVLKYDDCAAAIWDDLFKGLWSINSTA